MPLAYQVSATFQGRSPSGDGKPRTQPAGFESQFFRISPLIRGSGQRSATGTVSVCQIANALIERSRSLCLNPHIKLRDGLTHSSRIFEHSFLCMWNNTGTSFIEHFQLLTKRVLKRASENRRGFCGKLLILNGGQRRDRTADAGLFRLPTN
jgi:hypothetical protein